MAKQLDRKALTAHDPLARFDDAASGSGAVPASEPASVSASAAASAPERGSRSETADLTPRDPAAGERGRRSSTTIDFEAVDYQRIRRVAKARGLTVRGYIRSATLDRLLADETQRFS